ncbi:MAG: hypothetical protein WC003_02280 [Terrimicrobiaceae bacterium]
MAGLLAAVVLSRAVMAGDTQVGWSPGGGWRALEQRDLCVKAGSALDFSSLVEPGPAGKHGHVIINQQGLLAFKDQPGKAVRFLCCDEFMLWFPYQTQEQIDAYADQVVRAGYNIYRPHFLDTWLMRGSERDFELNPQRLDIWDRLQAALKQRGVYLFFDATTSWLMYSRIAPWSPEAKNVPLYQVTMNWDDAGKEHWKTGVANILSRVNPHTGMALKDDPQVAILQARNEATLLFRLTGSRTRSAALDKMATDHFRIWLRKKYADDDALRAAWTVQVPGGPMCYLKEGRSLDTVPMPDLKGRGPDTRDLFAFFMDTERATFLWEQDQLRQMGVKCPILDFNAMDYTYIQIVRDAMALTDSHAYHGHPSNEGNPGSEIGTTDSATKNFAGSTTWLLSSRQVGRPAVCSEWSHVFWQPWRGVEGGLITPAYAALQGWQMIGQHTVPVRLECDKPMKPFEIYNDPQNKAVERISALLFGRGDVRESPHWVQVNVDTTQALAGKLNLRNGLPGTMIRLELLSRFGIRVQGAPDSAPRAECRPDVQFNQSGDGTSLEIIGGGAQTVADDSADAGSRPNVMMEEVEALRSHGVLPKSNRTDPLRGIYQSDTGQIVLNSQKEQMEIDTPRSQGASLPERSPEARLSDLSVKAIGARMGVFLSAIDGKAISQSRRMLLVVTSDALNTDMRFKGPDRMTLVNSGTLPVLVQTGRVEVSVNNAHAGELKLWALDATGKRLSRVPVTLSREGRAMMTIDTAALPDGPSVYFELTAD